MQSSRFARLILIPWLILVPASSMASMAPLASWSDLVAIDGFSLSSKDHSGALTVSIESPPLPAILGHPGHVSQHATLTFAFGVTPATLGPDVPPELALWLGTPGANLAGFELITLLDDEEVWRGDLTQPPAPPELPALELPGLEPLQRLANLDLASICGSLLPAEFCESALGALEDGVLPVGTAGFEDLASPQAATRASLGLAASLAQVPEPGTALLLGLGLGALGLGARSRRR